MHVLVQTERFHESKQENFVFKFLDWLTYVLWWQAVTFFSLFYTLSEHTYNIYMYNSSITASYCLHRFFSVEGLLWGAEPRFELGPALQQAVALLFVPRRTLCSFLVLIKNPRFLHFCTKKIQRFLNLGIELFSGCWETQLTQACQVRPSYLGQTGAVLHVPARNSGNT
jgi:hypothetical protein